MEEEMKNTVEEPTPETAQTPAADGAKAAGRPGKAHIALTFCVGLAFISLVVWFIVEMILGIASIFHAKNVYSAGVDASAISGASALSEQLAAVTPESKEYFEILLADFIMQDPPVFKNAGELDSVYGISYGLWQAIALNNTQGILAVGEEDQQYRVPKALVEKMARYYLPSLGKLDHQSVEICGEFAYNKFNGTYTVPQSYPTDYLVPKVVSVGALTENDTLDVTVDCYKNNADPTEPVENGEKVKQVIVTLKKTENTAKEDLAVEQYHYTILSMRSEEEE